MTNHPPRLSPRSRGADRGYRRALAWGMAASVALHAAALFLFPAATLPGGDPEPEQASRPGIPDAVQAVSIRTSSPSGGQAPARAELPEELPAPVRSQVSMVQMEQVPVGSPTPSWASGKEHGQGSEGSASGSGAAGNGGGGGRGGFSPPVPRSLLPDWSPPDAVRGHRVTVRVEVDAGGRPTGRVELVPPTPSDEFNRRLRERMASLEFMPARRDGRPVAAWAEITFTF